MSRYFSYDQGNGLEWHDTAEEARTAALDALQYERTEATHDGWSDDVTTICWGEVRERVVMTDRITREDKDPPEHAASVLEHFDEYWDFGLRPVLEVTRG